MRRVGFVLWALVLTACSIERGGLGAASEAAEDGGIPPFDGATATDAGGGSTDAGPADAGGGSTDAGGGSTDAGPADAGPADAGCTPTTWYRDDDGDGYGNGSTAVTGCDPPSGGVWVTDGTDCDDGAGSTYPGAPEPCNAVDDDCNGTIDDGAGCPCNMRRRGGHPYLFCNVARTWSTARSDCQSVGYDLVVIGDGTENAWVWSQASGISGSSIDWFIGLQRDGGGRFVWVDGTVAWDGGAVGYSNFRGSGTPDGSGPCVEMGNDDGGGAWNDVACSQATSFACEAPR